MNNIEIMNMHGDTVYVIKDNRFYDIHGNCKYELKDDTLFDAYGNRKYQIMYMHLFDVSGNRKYRIKDGYLLDMNGNRKYQIIDRNNGNENPGCLSLYFGFLMRLNKGGKIGAAAGVAMIILSIIKGDGMPAGNYLIGIVIFPIIFGIIGSIIYKNMGKNE